MELVPSYTNNSKDPGGLYALLGVSPAASVREIRVAFKLIAQSKQGSPNYIQYVHAYKILSNPFTRNEYNMSKPKDPNLRHNYLGQARAGSIVLPVQELVIVGAKEYNYYRGKGESLEYEVVLEWYEELLNVFRLFRIPLRPRVAIHALGKACAWSVMNANAQIAHFDISMKPSFILALAAVSQSQLIGMSK